MNKLISSLLTLFMIISFVPASAQPAQQAEQLIAPRMRVIIDNDFAGDPDGLFQLVHHLLSPSVEIRGIIGSHLKPGDAFDSSDNTAGNAVKNVNEVLTLMNLQGKYAVHQGSNIALTDEKTPHRSAGAKAIIDEAMRTDTDAPLFVVCGGGLTEIASAYLIEPRIADRITLVWIGGTEHTELAAARVIFNQSDIHFVAGSPKRLPPNTSVVCRTTYQNKAYGRTG